MTTADALSVTTALARDSVNLGLLALEREGFAMQGRYRAGATGMEWVARRLLARMHAYSKRFRREGFDPVTAQDFMRFLLRWQHVAPETQLSGEAGLVAILDQLQGFEAAVGAWETALLCTRVRNYEPAWLDALCHAGEVAWLRLTPRAADELAAPSRATPTAVVLRSDLPWLVAAARGVEESTAPAHGATREVIEVLRERGGFFRGPDSRYTDAPPRTSSVHCGTVSRAGSSCAMASPRFAR